MWRWSETELNCVRIATRKIPELMQLLMGMSIRRYFPAIGTAGFERILVNGCKRVPLPPPIITPRTSFMDGIADLQVVMIHRAERSPGGSRSVPSRNNLRVKGKFTSGDRPRNTPRHLRPGHTCLIPWHTCLICLSKSGKCARDCYELQS